MRVQHNRSSFAIQSELVLVLACIEQRPSPLIDASFRQSLILAEAEMRRASEAYSRTKVALTHASAARQRQGMIMVKTVRDFYQGLNRAAKRNPTAQVWQEVFASQAELPKDAILTSQWYEQARQIAAAGTSAAAKRALTDGAPPPTNPSAEEVAATLPEAVASDLAWRDATRALKDSQAALRKAREEGKRLLVSLRIRLRVMAFGLSRQDRHALMHEYGFRFIADPERPQTPQPHIPDPDHDRITS